MYYRLHIPTFIAAIVLTLGVLLPVAIVGAVTEEDLADAKDQFNELWDTAAATTKRRAELEDRLVKMDSTVANAKRELAKTSITQKNVQEKIQERKKLTVALTQQMALATEARGLYTALAMTQKDEIVSFVRYLTTRDIALTESGPAVGGDLVKKIVRGSLGESIDRDLAHHALLRARRRLALQISVIAAEAEKAELTLRKAAEALQHDLASLEEQDKTLHGAAGAKQAIIDDHWRKKSLTHDELQHIEQETAEVNAKVASMQGSLLKINAELKAATLQKLRTELASAEVTVKALLEDKAASERKIQAMTLVREAALKALQETVHRKNTDKKLYKLIETDELRLANAEQTLSGSSDEGDEAHVLSARDIDALHEQIAELKEKLVLMKQGVPGDVALDYIRAKARAAEAEVVQLQLVAAIAENAPTLAAARTVIADTLSEIDKVENDTSLTGLPPLFTWPVRGTITAGYLDAAYVNVFRVPHRGMDIAVPQGTAIRTVSEGIVYAVKNGGAKGYSYILIGHRNGYTSLYGHLTKSFVKTGDIVAYGQTIGLTGGQPGTPGAGYMTTGQHLHLEFTKDGKHINPLTVLKG